MSNAAQDRRYRTQKQQREAKKQRVSLSPRWLARSIARKHGLLKNVGHHRAWRFGVIEYLERKDQQNQVRRIVRRRKPEALKRIKMEDA